MVAMEHHQSGEIKRPGKAALSNVMASLAVAMCRCPILLEPEVLHVKILNLRQQTFLYPFSIFLSCDCNSQPVIILKKVQANNSFICYATPKRNFLCMSW